MMAIKRDGISAAPAQLLPFSLRLPFLLYVGAWATDICKNSSGFVDQRLNPLRFPLAALG